MLEALVCGVRFCLNVGWPVFKLTGDNWSALEQASPMRARSGLSRPNRHLPRLFYVLCRLGSTIYLD